MVGDEPYQSSDDDGAKDTSELQEHQHRSSRRIKLHPKLGGTDSEDEDGDGEALRLSVPQSGSQKSTTV